MLLFAAACFGHLVLLVRCHNWFYGQAWPKRLGDLMHLLHGGLFVAGPVALLVYWGWDLSGLFALGEAPWYQWLVCAYLALCWAAAGVLFPAITLQRWLRREPVLEARSEVVDMARQLGYRPAGTDKERFLTYFPGNEVFQVEFGEKTIAPPRLPREWDGLTVLHLSDLHLNGTPDRAFFQGVMDRCAAWQPDLVAVTGDIADSWRHQRWIVPILGRLRWQVAGLAILGNHDYWYDPAFIRRRLRRVRFSVLSNAWQELTVRGLPLVVIGQEYPWRKPHPDLEGCPQGPFRLCLSHTPDNVAWGLKNGVDLMLSGHVHGGQIRVPGVGSVLVPSKLSRRYDGGTYQVGPMVLHVSRGLSGEHPVRFHCRPEVTLLRLRSAS